MGVAIMAETPTKPLSIPTQTLSDALANLVKGADEFAADEGSVEVIITSGNIVAQAKIERVAGHEIQVGGDGLSFVNLDTGARRRLSDDEIYYTRHDDPTFGRNAPDDDEWDESFCRDCGWLDCECEAEDA